MTDTTGHVPPAAPPAAPTAAPEVLAAPPAAAVPPQPGPEQPGPPAVAGDAWSPAPELLEAAASDRRRTRAALLRWGAVALVLLLSGTAAALAVTAPDRTDIPGLATPGDGRYAFPPLTLPQLPSGKPDPGQVAAAGRHYADLRGLLLPPPRGAVLEQPTATGKAASPAAAGAAPSGASAAAAGVPWLACTDYAAGDGARARLDAAMAEYACRAATRRTWTAADGTRTDIWLFRFGSQNEAHGLFGEIGWSEPKGVPALHSADVEVDPSLPTSMLTTQAGDQKAKNGPTARAAYLQQGDVVAGIVMTNPDGVAVQAYRQVALLQSQMLR
ncbi:hypothetical protein [Kitasatospora sp. NPDC051914]|uniref:hypothetical protein n=1 Tax=Kitasatospora sp. NPDC051914 TaxID=3154945 RepID=UPI00341DF642